MEPNALAPAARVGTTSLTPCTEGTKPGGGKKRQRPLSLSGQSPPIEQSLRQFSLKVAQQVQTKRETTYNEVAEALVDEMIGKERTPEQDHDERNLRRCAASHMRSLG
jgi:hypothetical protein